MDKNYKLLEQVYEENMLYPITIIFGGVGVGKTALMTYFALSNIICGRDRLLNCIDSINDLNKIGYNFNVNNLKTTVASNYIINSNCKYSSGIESYVVNPFKLALPNENISYMVFPSWFNFYITEAQAHLNSRKSRNFRSCVSRLYENCRHNNYTITLDCQRPNLLDLNIREIANKFVKVLSLDKKYNKQGTLIKCTWKVLIFNDWSMCNKYIETNDSSFAIKKVYTYYGDIFSNYNSYENKMAFYDFSFDRQLDLLTWDMVDNKFLIVPNNYYE